MAESRMLLRVRSVLSSWGRLDYRWSSSATRYDWRVGLENWWSSCRRSHGCVAVGRSSDVSQSSNIRMCCRREFRGDDSECRYYLGVLGLWPFRFPPLGFLRGSRQYSLLVGFGGAGGTMGLLDEDSRTCRSWEFAGCLVVEKSLDAFHSRNFTTSERP